MEDFNKLKLEAAQVSKVIADALPDEIKSGTQLSILSATIYLIGKNGIDNTTIDEVAQVAGVGKGTVFLHFTDKKTLIIESLKTTLSVIYHEITKETEPFSEPIDKLQAQITLLTNLVLSYKHNIFFELFKKCKPEICQSQEWLEVINKWDKVKYFTWNCVEDIANINDFDEEQKLMITIILLAPFLYTMFMMQHEIKEQKFHDVLELMPKYFLNIERMLNLKRGAK